MNNKAISAVVATVLIILITVAAVTIIWVAIIPMIRENTGGATACLAAVSDLSIVTEEGYTAYDSTAATGGNYDLQVQVSRGAGDYDLDDIEFYVGLDNGDTAKLTLANAEGVSDPLVDADYPSVNGKKTYKFMDENFVDTPVSVSIAPKLTTGNTATLCDTSSTVDDLDDVTIDP